MAIIRFLKEFENINIIVLEADVKPVVKDMDGVTRIFIEDHNPLFHKNKYIKMLFDNSTTKFVGIWDCDVIVSKRMIEDAMNQLRSDNADMSIPYNGLFCNVTGQLLEAFIQSGNVDLLLENQSETGAVIARHSCGGAFIVNRDKHFEAGGENLKFTSWGPEDLERYKRWEICDMRVHRGSEPMFHLHHQRSTNSWYADEEIRQRLNLELIKTCRSTKKELMRENG
jgi:predicted glycosyltransferase involved in capsule biosynthesis